MIVEELRISQTGAHHTGVTRADRFTSVFSLKLRHKEEAIHQAALFVLHGKILLILLHGKNETLLRNLQEFFFKRRFIDNGPFGQSRHFINQVFRHDRFAADAFGAFGDVMDDLFTALRKGRHHLGFLNHLFFVAISRTNGDEFVRMETVTAR